jgi:hypothetical protein
MKQLVRYFSLGLLTAGIIMLGVVLFSDSNGESKLTAEEIIPILKNEGYHVLSNSEYIAMTVNPNENKSNQNSDKEAEKNSDSEKSNKNDENKKKEKEKNETDEKQAKKDDENKNKSYVVNVKSGMPTSSISTILEENGIIEKASEFTKYLEKHEYSLKVKAKKTEVTSDMSYYELAQALINY